MTSIAVLSPVERVARVIAAEALSPNAEGEGIPGETGVSDQVEGAWREELDRALAVLRTLREPTPEMLDAGRAAGSDPADIWNAMVRAAIEQRADETA